MSTSRAFAVVAVVGLSAAGAAADWQPGDPAA
jgi:hypothetical protein